MTATANKLRLPKAKIARARRLAARIAKPVQDYISLHTTITVERATLRLLGADGANDSGVPVPNLIADAFPDELDGGLTRFYVSMLIRRGCSCDELNRSIDGFFSGSACPFLGQGPGRDG